MSAFVCSDLHINTLVTYAVKQRVSWAGMTETGQQIRRNAHEDPKFMAALLYRANVESVNHRYGDNRPEDDFVFAKVPSLPDPVRILKLCNCFDYQSCETDYWEVSEAYNAIQAIKEEAIRNLPGYNEAKWSI